MTRFLKALALAVKEQFLMLVFYSVSIAILYTYLPLIVSHYDSVGRMNYIQGGRHGWGYSGGEELLFVIFSGVAVVYFTYSIPRDIYRSIIYQLKNSD